MKKLIVLVFGILLSFSVSAFGAEDNVSIQVGNAEWPTGKVAAIIPKFTKGTVFSTMTSDEFCSIDIEDVEKKDFDSYVKTLKNAGFTKDAALTGSDNDGYFYQALDKNGKMIIVSYQVHGKLLQIMGASGK